MIKATLPLQLIILIVIIVNIFYKYITKRNDQFYINDVAKANFSSDKDFIYLSYYQINRKTLALSVKQTEKEVGTCEVFNTHKSLDLKLKEVKDKIQEKYNKSLEGNKI